MKDTSSRSSPGPRSRAASAGLASAFAGAWTADPWSGVVGDLLGAFAMVGRVQDRKALAVCVRVILSI